MEQGSLTLDSWSAVANSDDVVLDFVGDVWNEPDHRAQISPAALLRDALHITGQRVSPVLPGLTGVRLGDQARSVQRRRG